MRGRADGIQDHAVAGIQGHAVAEAPTGVARALLYLVRGSPLFHPQSMIQVILPYLSSIISLMSSHRHSKSLIPA